MQKAIFLALLMTTAVVSAQEDAPSPAPETEISEGKETDGTQEKDVAIKKHSFLFSAGPALMISTDSTKKSAPSPITFCVGAGGTLFQNMPISFQPRLSFFVNYYLWDGDNARPAEIENRTAIALSFLLDLNAVKIIRYKNHTFQAGGGLGVLARFGILSNGVDANGSGSNENTSVSNNDDVSSINSWFWSSAHFLYPDIMFCWLYNLPNGWKAGVSANVYVPVGSLADGRGMDGMIIAISGRLEI
ncbi:MAG: hypothetical protein IJS09_02510 [Treponema sp.]|nr:hypothetical protein [Treponema sp.]